MSMSNSVNKYFTIPPLLHLIVLVNFHKVLLKLNKRLSAHALNKQMTCVEPDAFFRTSSRQPVRPYTL